MMSSHNFFDQIGEVKAEVQQYRNRRYEAEQAPDNEQLRHALGVLVSEATVGTVAVGLAAPNTLAQMAIVSGTAAVMAVHGLALDRRYNK